MTGMIVKSSRPNSCRLICPYQYVPKLQLIHGAQITMTDSCPNISRIISEADIQLYLALSHCIGSSYLPLLLAITGTASR